MSRLFVALDLPDDCRRRLAGLGPPPDGVRLLGEDDLHLTLAFLGEVEDSAQPGIEERLAEVRAEPFDLEIRGLDTFGRPRPTILYAAVQSPPAALFRLHERVCAALRAAGHPPDDKPFRPHVTVGRAKNVTRGQLRPLLDRHSNERFCRARIGGFALFSSVLRPHGAEHQVQRRWSLGG